MGDGSSFPPRGVTCIIDNGRNIDFLSILNEVRVRTEKVYTHDADHVMASVNSVQCSIQIQCTASSAVASLIVLSHFLAVTGNRARSLIKGILLVVIKNIFCSHAKGILDLQLKF